ncbi:MAG: DUF6883 domain-containing protein [Bryobacteraceae bacterium]|jgi:hypothetical protein
MKLPGGEHAIVEVVKLREYCLNPSHPRGRHKARVFSATLGLKQPDAEFLRRQLLRAARDEVATKGDSDQHGERYFVDFDLARANRRVRVRSAWIVRRGERVPRLTSCYVLLD